MKVIDNIIIDGNYAGRNAGAITIYQSHPIITNSIITNNSANGVDDWKGLGGGIYIWESSISINNSEISNNTAIVYSVINKININSSIMSKIGIFHYFFTNTIVICFIYIACTHNIH